MNIPTTFSDNVRYAEPVIDHIRLIHRQCAELLAHEIDMDTFKLTLNAFFETEWAYKCQGCFGKGCSQCNNTGYLSKPIPEPDEIEVLINGDHS
jgi:hypothetical protein